MRLLDLASIQRRSRDLSPHVLQPLDKTSSPHSELITCMRILKGRQDDVSNLDDFSRISDISFQIVCREII